MTQIAPLNGGGDEEDESYEQCEATLVIDEKTGATVRCQWPIGEHGPHRFVAEWDDAGAPAVETDPLEVSRRKDEDDRYALGQDLSLRGIW